jgi:hypothetical protein
MKTEDEIKEKLEELEGDERLHYKPAQVQINAPLALLQVGLETGVNALRWALDMEPHKRGVKYVRGE